MGTEHLEKYENYYPTTTGGAYIGERAVLHGRDLLNDLSHLSWVELLFFSITGFEGNSERIKILENIWTGCSYPDPRLWNNRVASLAASTRSTATLAVSAGVALSEATIYGHRANIRAIDAIIKATQAVKDGACLTQFIEAHLKRGLKFYGFGRPISGQDERIAPTLARIEALSDQNLPHIKTAFQLESFLKKSKGLQMNITGLSAALAADCGMSARQYHQFLGPCFMSGIIACYTDALDKPMAAVFPMRCQSINYTGTSEKKYWPDDESIALKGQK